MAASATVIEEFLAGPLVTWLATCVKKPETLQVYETFFDGSPIAEVLLQIDPEPSQPVPSYSNLQASNNNITFTRTKIFHSIIKNIQNIYEEELGQTIVSLPDCVALGRSPGSETSLEQLKLLLLLLLGCAVQGPTKEHFITKIKQLPVDAQHDIVECIKRVTDDQNLVLTLDWSEQTAQRLYKHIQTLTSERNRLVTQWIIDLGQEVSLNGSTSASEVVESNHLAVELADWKARLRKQRQELEEKTEILTECREELEHATSLISKLKTENGDLVVEARRAKAYRDENDALREKVERADRLEAEVQRYRERLADAEFYKVRVDELREDNRVLLETREMLESQLVRTRQRADHVLQLEAELLNNKQNLNDVLVERDAAKERINELIEENLQLQQVTKSALLETSSILILDEEHEETNSGDNSLSEQLTNNAQARALRLELENKKLLSVIDALKEKSVNENAEKVLELEKEKKKLVLKCDQLEENSERLNQQNCELENLFKNAIHENRKLQDSIDTLKLGTDRQAQDLQNERVKIAELEKNIESLTKEKQRIQTLCDTIKKRADDAEKSLNQATDQLQLAQTHIDGNKTKEKQIEELKDRIAGVEKENATMQRDITKLKESLEAKDVILDKEIDKSTKQTKEIQKLVKEIEMNFIQLEKLQEFEQKTQELQSQTSIYTETIATLQKDLIAEKVNGEKFKNNLEKLGLNLDLLDNDINVIVEQILSNPVTLKLFSARLSSETKCEQCTGSGQLVKEASEERTSELQENLAAEIANLQHVNETLQAENAKLQVNVSTVKSQVHSLQTQQTALQLANSQLVAEKDELAKQNELQSAQYDTLLLDQITLRTLHEQLSSEYEQLKTEQETVKKLNRDLRCETRILKDKANDSLEKIAALETEKNCFKNDAKNLGILRAEHSKLKDDFRNLFTAGERLKIEYRNVQEELQKVRTESRTLRLGQTEMQGELNCSSDLVAGLQLENAKLQQKCDMLFEMNHSLDSDRRALMEHVSQLLSQYHSLLTHSLEDKQHYHHEEKLYTDKVNNLCRQKEKLEEKIMEHYRKLDNASAKKKGFGAAFVKKVRKAGSDIISKVPSRNRRSWHEDTSRLTQSQFTLGGGGSGESGGNDSDNSASEETAPKTPFKRSSGGSLHGHHPRDEVALRRSHRDMAAHRNSIAGDPSYNRETATTEPSLSLGSVGSRRTVYLSEDEPAATAANSTNSAAAATSTPAPPPVNNQNSSQPPMLVYNRISTVIGDQAGRPAAQAIQHQQHQKNSEENVKDVNSEKKSSDNAKETAVWYEYGCV